MPKRLKPDVKLASKELQLMVRAEAASFHMYVKAIVKGERSTVWSPRGHCACVTCGKVLPWKSSSAFGFDQMQGGHFDHSPRTRLIIQNVNPQCAGCNKWKNGAPREYKKWMEWHWGKVIIREIEEMKRGITDKMKDIEKQSHIIWSDDDIISFRERMRIRINEAVKIIEA